MALTGAFDASWREFQFCIRVSKKKRSRKTLRAHVSTSRSKLATGAAQLNCPAASDQVDHRYDERNHEQEMNQTAGHVKSPAEKPEDDENRENCPKHRYPLKIKKTYIDCQKVRGSFLSQSCL